jgi:heat shock protein HtpX
MRKDFSLDFYEIQRQQWKKSLFLIVILFLFYFFAFGFISATLIAIFSLILADKVFPSGTFLTDFLLINASVAVIVASFHYYDAKKNGARYILKRMRAQPPDSSDRYHQRFVNTVEEIRFASGMPEVTPLIIPDFAINSMALISSDDTPMVMVTEGLLAECTRDEIQAVAAHELAHVIRGDTFYITLVCSLANFFERIREALEPKYEVRGNVYAQQEGGAGPPLLYLAVTISSIIMRLLSTLISREREILADAVGVELSRNPRALARAIYKAHLKNSFVGDFNLTYSPLFIVPPESRGNGEGFFSRIFNSHPPLMKRIKLLSDMIKTAPAAIIEEVWEIHRIREKARTTLFSREESIKGKDITAQETEEPSPEAPKIWAIRDSKGNWQGPISIEELLFIRFFTPMILIRNIQEGIESPAREFPQIRNALRNLFRKKPINPARRNRCPRCHKPLGDSHYEGVSIKICRRCGGKLIDSGVMERILTRKEVGFSKHLTSKAKEFREKFILNPFLAIKVNLKKSSKIFCPNCGSRMIPRPYTYQYVIPVDKCLSCYKIWFDADELEILQILTENH